MDLFAIRNELALQPVLAWLKMVKTSIRLSLVGITAMAGHSLVEAQNTGGVFGPVVNEGHRSVQYRATYRPGEDGMRDGFAQRVHYQQAIRGDVMWRLVGQVQRTLDSDFDPAFLQGELFWQITPDKQDWQTGLRLDLTWRDGDQPESVGLHWMNQFSLNESTTLRTILLTQKQMGDRALDGVVIQTRGGLYKDLGRYSMGLEIYSAYGSTSSWRNWNDQIHQVGPVLNYPLSDQSSVYLNWLTGLTDNSPDNSFRVWFTQGF
jgi:hypothetical protein